ncbi:optic atrophy 3 protein-domain-containing protein [Gymnopilus junonius]|uniref:Optic atrophy 3 protein-domain-containing protein n=1 Tax=Gymnopilus junonius TaxID=109634 RepID=A0A9P5TT27_GYMJU|nr:optic atrophy 3 protein-domain-containing protein [Gymnopilus junonius]
MASAKIATLIIRTLAKPISNQIKQQVKQHERFRALCVDLAQFMYRSEVKLRQNILGEPASKHIRPLAEAKAIDNGANALAEGFLFSVAAALIIAETWRSSRNASKRRDTVDEQLEDLGTRLVGLTTRVDELVRQWEDEKDLQRERYNDLARILEKVIENGMNEQAQDVTDMPVHLPRIKLAPPLGDNSQAMLQSPNTSTSSLHESVPPPSLPPSSTPSNTTSSSRSPPLQIQPRQRRIHSLQLHFFLSYNMEFPANN